MNKKIIHLLFILLLTNNLTGQNKGALLVITDLKANLLIDGESKGEILANKPTKFEVFAGEHFLEIKSEHSDYSDIVTIHDHKQRVLKVTLSKDKAKIHQHETKIPELEAIKVADLTTTLSGSNDTYYYAFQKGDELIVDFKTKNKKGTNQLVIYEYPENIKYENRKFRNLSNVKIKVDKKSIYRFSMSSNYIFERDCKIFIKRKPSHDSTVNFNTKVVLKKVIDTAYTSQTEQVLVKRDTVYTELKKTDIRVHSTTNLFNSNRTVVNFHLPPETQYWVYWIGVGQESVQEMKKLAEHLSTLSSVVPSPLAAFGLGLIPSLPALNTTATVNYVFTDSANESLFSQGQKYSYYLFKKGDKVSADYAKIDMDNTPSVGNLHMCFWNNHGALGRDVNVRIGAFSFRDKYETVTKKEPYTVTSYVPVFEE